MNWTKLPFLVQMYDIIYDEMVDARVAVSIEELFTKKQEKLSVKVRNTEEETT